MNLGKRIELRLGELKKSRSYLFEMIPELNPSTLSLLISRDSSRTKFEGEIAKSLGVTLSWLKLGHSPKSISMVDIESEIDLELIGLIRKKKHVKAAIRVFHKMSDTEKLDFIEKTKNLLKPPQGAILNQR